MDDKEKHLIFHGIAAITILAAGFYFIAQNKADYVFDRSKFCPEQGNCIDLGIESRECIDDGDCIASCNYGCVNSGWVEGRNDCEAIWPDFECGCIANICQRR